MDNVSNEVLAEIISHLDMMDLPILRLVNFRFNQLVTPVIAKLFSINIGGPSKLKKFVKEFEHHVDVMPFQNFTLSDCVLWFPGLEEPLTEFSIKFGKFVKTWDILKRRPPRIRKGEIYAENAKVLGRVFEHCVNAVEFTHFLYHNEVLKEVPVLPIFKNLRTFNVMYRGSQKLELGDEQKEEIYFQNFLYQLFEKAPNLSNISVKGTSAVQVQLTRFLNQVTKTKIKVNIKLDIGVRFPANVGDLENLVKVATQLKVVEMNIQIDRSAPLPSMKKLTPTIEVVTNCIEKMKFLKKLTISDFHRGYCRGRPMGHVYIPLLSASLESLDGSGVHILGYPNTQIPFPALKTLKFKNCRRLSFAGSVFPNVRVAHISFKLKEEILEWPLILPNVEELTLSCESFEGIFQFQKLRRLDIRVKENSNKEGCNTHLHWKQLTGGAKYISNEEICFSSLLNLETDKDSGSSLSFKNLPGLTHLNISGQNIECWKAIIYASRTGSLAPLLELTLGLEEFPEEDSYRQILMTYHYLVTGSPSGIM